jgi:hypothetical protein
VEDSSIFTGGVTFYDNKKTTTREGSYLYKTDTEVRKHGEQTELETLVVHALNDEC